VQEKARILAYEHEYACSSAYFDATGTRLATTSYDDSIRGAFRCVCWIASTFLTVPSSRSLECGTEQAAQHHPQQL
jgi:hypothetical protein